MPSPTWFDRAIGSLSPSWQVRRLRARMMAEIVQRHYEGASNGRRTQGWQRPNGDANALIGPALSTLRASARELVRNNPYAERGVSTIVNDTVGWGIKGKPKTDDKRLLERWDQWAESTQCDAEGRLDFYGLQKLAMRTVVESGEVLVRRRLRRPEDGLAIPMQIQILDPDFLDTSKDTATGQPMSGGNVVIQGVEFDALGRRIAYWLFRQHPGSASGSFPESVRVPADGVQHIFRSLRPGQVRGPSWFAPVLLRFKDFDEFEDATLMKQKIAACLAALITDPNGSSEPLGVVDTTKSPQWDMLEPGALINIAPGRDVKMVDPPQAGDYKEFSETVLRAIATGLGVTYEDLTGDYAGMPFSAARMSRLSHWANVDEWRWQLLIPQLCDPVWNWAMQAAAVNGSISAPWPDAVWSAPPPPMVDPANEGLALQRIVRNGLDSLSNVLRERGFDPKEKLTELANDFKLLDELGLKLDIDPRHTTQAGQTQADPAAEPAAEPAPTTDAARRERLHLAKAR